MVRYSRPGLLVAALGPAMLKIAGEWADGTVTWMTGIATIGDHIAPGITKSAASAGRAAPRIATSLPVTVTSDPDSARERINKEFAIYPNLPSYKAMLDKEGVTSPAEIAFVGTEEEVAKRLSSLESAGATDFVAAAVGNSEERKRTVALLASLARGTA
jgi:5,10-methylenetetrahydromethanopterin reductase